MLLLPKEVQLLAPQFQEAVHVSIVVAGAAAAADCALLLMVLLSALRHRRRRPDLPSLSHEALHVSLAVSAMAAAAFRLYRLSPPFKGRGGTPPFENVHCTCHLLKGGTPLPLYISEHVLCTDFNMYYVQILACLMCRF